MFKNLISKFTNEDIVVDMTSGSTVIAQVNNGVIVNEPSLIVIDQQDKCDSVGKEAAAKRGKTPNGIKVISPIQNGVIAEPEYCESMLKMFLGAIYSRKSLLKLKLDPRILAVVPQDITAAERKTYEETFEAVGCKEVILLPSLIAGACGANIKIEECSAAIVCNIGSTYTEVGLISMNTLHSHSRVEAGMETMTDALVQFVKTHTDFTIGEMAAREALLGFASAVEPADDADACESITIIGTIKRTSSPVHIELTREQIHIAIAPCITRIINAVIEVLEGAREDMAEDLLNNGVTIIGEGAIIENINVAIEQYCQIKTRIAPNAQTCIAEGATTILRRM